AGHLFQPSGWSIYCSRAPGNVHCVALLASVRSPDPVTAAHRAALISLAADVAWVLFLHRLPRRLAQHLRKAAGTGARAAAGGGRGGGGGPQGRLRRAMVQSLRRWSTHGLERLLLELVVWYQFLRGQQQGGQQGEGGEDQQQEEEQEQQQA
ncbi:hypothetical protein Agub_g12671, partial [Astrephomene gubernaculifera]